MQADSEMQHCPICEKAIARSHRYPRALCGACSRRVTATDGRPLTIGNRFTSAPIGRLDPETGQIENRKHVTIGPMQALDSETGEPRDDIERMNHGFVCYVDGRRCLAGEAYFGGTVVEAL